jgi:hypothetical protein
MRLYYRDAHSAGLRGAMALMDNKALHPKRSETACPELKHLPDFTTFKNDEVILPYC